MGFPRPPDRFGGVVVAQDRSVAGVTSHTPGRRPDDRASRTWQQTTPRRYAGVNPPACRGSAGVNRPTDTPKPPLPAVRPRSGSKCWRFRVVQSPSLTSRLSGLQAREPSKPEPVSRRSEPNRPESPGGNYVPWSTASKTVRACSNGWDVIPRCVPNGWSSQKTRNSSKPSSTATALESRT